LEERLEATILDGGDGNDADLVNLNHLPWHLCDNSGRILSSLEFDELVKVVDIADLGRDGDPLAVGGTNLSIVDKGLFR